YELFTGEKLFPGDDAEEITANIHNMPIPRASAVRRGLPPRLDVVLGRALERDPDQRPSKPGELVRALVELSYESSIVATALDVAETVESALKTRKGGDAAAVAEPAGGLDDLIRKQLSGATAPGAARRTDVSERELDPDGGIALEPTEAARPGAESGDRKKKTAGADSETHTATIVKKGVDADGLTLWEFESGHDEDTVAAVPSAIRSGRRTGSLKAIDDTGEREQQVARAGSRRRFVIALMLVAATGLAAVGGWMIWGPLNGSRIEPLVVTPPEIDAGLANPRPPRLATISIDSTPSGAAVWVDGTKLADPTPTSVMVTAEEPHNIEVRADGYRRWTVDGVTVPAGEAFPLAPTLVRVVATLKVTTAPTGARVKLDGKVIGRTPLERDDLPPGKNVPLVLSKPGYQPAKLTVDLDPSEPKIVDRVLKVATRYGKISLYIDGGWANVYLRDRKVGRAPQKELPLPLGKHRLRLHNPHSEKEQFLNVEVVESEVKYYRVRW
ncbi:MAG: PEGA domain-containing protein, partial [Deltaproteobacteria bacterium]|nr:PEGA domain-containing protein [Deltaproteobacteria bacterium]